jgi:5'-3' exonuclease
MKHLLIDADPLVYRSLTTKDTTTLEDHTNYFDYIMEWIIFELHPFAEKSDYSVFLSGGTNFRKDLYEDYKANRKGEKPKLLPELQQHVKDTWDPIVCHGMEADDGIAIAATQRGFKNVIIASSDKDFKQLPCEIYSTYHWKRETITKAEALRNLWTQVLTGDSVDNIKGAKGVGPKKAYAILKGCHKPADYEQKVRQVFLDISPETGEEDFSKAYTCIRLLRSPKELVIIQDSMKETKE